MVSTHAPLPEQLPDKPVKSDFAAEAATSVRHSKGATRSERKEVKTATSPGAKGAECTGAGWQWCVWRQLRRTPLGQENIGSLFLAKGCMQTVRSCRPLWLAGPLYPAGRSRGRSDIPRRTKGHGKPAKKKHCSPAPRVASS